MGLAGLTATGVCSMVGAGINVIPFMIQRNVPGIGPFVLEAFAFAALPAVLAAIAYAVLASAMPRAGGSYVYVSRGLGPYLGFVASFSQWFALSVATGVVSYVFVPFVRDIALALGWSAAAASLETGWLRLTLSLAVLWAAAGVNLRGVALYQRLMVPLMYLTFILAGVVIVAGFSFDHADFSAVVLARDGRAISMVEASPGAPEQIRAGEAAYYESCGRRSWVRGWKPRGRRLPRSMRKVETTWSSNKYGLIASAQTPNHGIKAEALFRIWLKYWADKVRSRTGRSARSWRPSCAITWISPTQTPTARRSR